MKKIAFLFIGLILASLCWMGFMREPLPALPIICGELSDEVNFDFSISSMDYSGVELSMNEKVNGQGMFVQFKMANAFKSGRPGLVLSGIKSSSGMRDGMSPRDYLLDAKRKENGGRDFSTFMKDKKGKAVAGYSFKQTLVEGENGKTYLRMSYDGPAMDMIETLEIPRPVTIPTHVAGRFAAGKVIRFQASTVAFDQKIKGFYIPVEIK